MSINKSCKSCRCMIQKWHNINAPFLKTKNLRLFSFPETYNVHRYIEKYYNEMSPFKQFSHYNMSSFLFKKDLQNYCNAQRSLRVLHISWFEYNRAVLLHSFKGLPLYSSFVIISSVAFWEIIRAWISHVREYRSICFNSICLSSL